MEEQDILVEVRDGVAWVTINRPQVMNAWTIAAAATLHARLGELAQRDDVRCVVIRGAGDKAFSSGQDLKEMAQLRAQRLEGRVTENAAALVQRIGMFPKPTLAAVKGYVRGGGNWLAAICDIAIAAEDATFSMTQINFGVFEKVPSVALIRRIGRSRLMDMLLTADVFDAHQAKAMGLVDRVAPVDGFWQAVEDLARKIASRDPQAVKAGKEALWLLTDFELGKIVPMMKNAMLVEHMSRDAGTSTQQLQQFIGEVRGTGAKR